MSDVEVSLGAAGLGGSSVDVWLSDDDLLELYEDYFEGYCAVCHHAHLATEVLKLCCACFEEEAKNHAECCGDVMADAAEAVMS
jgi:hypothetical protein